VPGGIDLLVWMCTAPRWSGALLPDRDRISSWSRLQVVPEPQREGGSIEGQVDRLAGGDLLGGDLGW